MNSNCFSNKTKYALLFISTLFLFNQNLYANTLTSIIDDSHQKISLQFDLSISTQQQNTIYQWIKHSSASLKLIYGEFPVDHLIVKIKTSHRGSDPVPWGEVNRYDPPEVTFVVNVNSDLNTLKEDWTSYHEFSHLLIPYDADDSRWLSEGLASYYQNILQARSGMFSEQMMWQKLFEGFERARKQSNLNHQNLTHVSERIRTNHNFMRIYWSGALYWLNADIALRKLNKNVSLDSALLQLHQCCSSQSLTSSEIIQKLDSLTDNKVFSTLFQTFSKSLSIPEYLSTLHSLGVAPKSDIVSINENAEFSLLRQKIFKGK